MSSRPTRCLLYGGPVALIAAVGLYVAEFVRWPAYITQIDLMVYRFGGHRVLQGLDLYSTGIFGSHRVLLFTYTPFAALCFTPLNMLSLSVVAGLVAGRCHRIADVFGAADARRIRHAAPSTMVDADRTAGRSVPVVGAGALLDPTRPDQPRYPGCRRR